jgi:hypothetical protein
MTALGEKLLQASESERNRVGSRDADDIEALCARGVRERGFECGGIAQKSRSA